MATRKRPARCRRRQPGRKSGPGGVAEITPPPSGLTVLKDGTGVLECKHSTMLISRGAMHLMGKVFLG